MIKRKMKKREEERIELEFIETYKTNSCLNNEES